MGCAQLSVLRRIRAISLPSIDEGLIFPPVKSLVRHNREIRQGANCLTSEHSIDHLTAKMKQMLAWVVLLIVKLPSHNSNKQCAKSRVKSRGPKKRGPANG